MNSNLDGYAAPEPSKDGQPLAPAANPRSTELPSGVVSGASEATHVVEAPSDISAASLRQLLRQLRGGRVILVLSRAPRHVSDTPHPTAQQRSATAPLETGLVRLQVVRRQAEAQGLEVAIVSRDEKLRQQAADAGLPAFSTVEGAQEHTWRIGSSRLEVQPPRAPRDLHDPIRQKRLHRLPARFRRVRLHEGAPKPLSPVLEMILLAAVLVAALIAVTGVVAFIVPKASVTLVPAQEPLAKTVTIRARSDAEQADFDQKIIPARRIGQRVEADGTIQATGTRSAPDQPAQGSVVFTNRTPGSLEIPPGTIVSTSTGSNVRFETMQPAVLSGGLGSQVTVPIRATEPGPAGNVRAFTINTVEGPLGVSANVVNPSGTGGGTVKQVATINQADKDRLRAQLLQEATQKAYVALGDLLDEGEFVPPETVNTIVVDETYDRFTDEEANEVTLRLRVLATALAVSGQAGDEMALQALSDSIPRRGQLLSDSVTYTHGPAVVTEDGDNVEINFDTTASAVVVLDVDPAAVRAAIRGRPPAEAVEQLEANWRLQTAPELTLGPDWLQPVLRRLDFSWLPLPVADRVPWLPFRTQVKVLFEG